MYSLALHGRIFRKFASRNATLNIFLASQIWPRLMYVGHIVKYSELRRPTNRA